MLEDSSSGFPTCVGALLQETKLTLSNINARETGANGYILCGKMEDMAKIIFY